MSINGSNSTRSQNIQDLLQVNAIQGEQLATLTKIVQGLQTRLNKDSHNSGKCPSSDGPEPPSPKVSAVNREDPLVDKPGHHGSTLRMQDNPDHVVTHSPNSAAAVALP